MTETHDLTGIDPAFISKKTTVKRMIYLTFEQDARIRAIAKAESRPISAQIRMLIDAGLRLASSD